MAWPRSFIDAVRSSTDARQVIGEIVALKKRGTRWVGLCPFHQEKTPSFTVNDEGLWYCFGCGEGGDIFKFLQQHEGVGFADAVRAAADSAGIPVPESTAGRRDAERGPQVPRDRVLSALAAAQEYYTAQLAGPGGTRAREYLEGRGVAPEIIDGFRLGYAPAGWEGMHQALSKRGFDAAEMEAAGLVKRRADGSGIYDLLRDRIVFPIGDMRRRPIAFGGRVLDAGEPKYLNSPETSVFLKSRTLYGLGEARQAIRDRGFVMLVEGYLDLLACVQYGFANVVAPLGTAFTAEHAKILGSHARKAVIAFDGDNAGLTAAERSVGMFLPAGFQVSVLRLPPGQDPDSFLATEGTDGMAEALRHALPALSFLVARAGERGDLTSPQGKARALAELLTFVLDVEDRVERAEWIGRIAEALEIGEHLVARSFAELRQRGRHSPGQGSAEPPPLAATEARLEEPPLAERDLLRAVLAQPKWLPDLVQICGAEAVRDARVAGLLKAVTELASEGDLGARPAPERLLEKCDVVGADRLLSRLLVESGDAPEFDYARGCALGIRRDWIRSELRRVQRSIESAERAGDGDISQLEQRKLALAQELRGA